MLQSETNLDDLLRGAEQGEAGWYLDRAGHATASRFSDVLANGKGGKASITRRKYMLQLVTERLLGGSVEEFRYRNAAMDWGKANEAAARMSYEAFTGAIVDESPFVRHPTIKWVGCSPDGLVDDDGAIEIKCPENPVIHIATVAHGMPPEHVDQVEGVLWVTGRHWIDFISYDPRVPPHLQLYVERIKRPDSFGALEAGVRRFLEETEAIHRRLLNYKPGEIYGLS